MKPIGILAERLIDDTPTLDQCNTDVLQSPDNVQYKRIADVNTFD